MSTDSPSSRTAYAQSHRAFLGLSAGVAATFAMPAAASAAPKAGEPLLRFGVIADCQYADKPDPGQYLPSDMPPVLTIALPRRVPSPRFRLIAHPLASVWMHHLELPDASTIDSEVASWLREAYDAAQ